MVRRAQRRGRGGGKPALRWLVLALRALALCLALQCSGVVHFVVDLCLSGEAAAAHFSDCPDDEDGKQCPPGCPSCHCTHVSPALPPVLLAVASWRVLPFHEVAWAPGKSGRPPSPARRSLYRPPRA